MGVGYQGRERERQGVHECVRGMRSVRERAPVLPRVSPVEHPILFSEIKVQIRCVLGLYM
jgi:hypothetical protein